MLGSFDLVSTTPGLSQPIFRLLTVPVSTSFLAPFFDSDDRVFPHVYLYHLPCVSAENLRARPPYASVIAQLNVACRIRRARGMIPIWSSGVRPL